LVAKCLLDDEIFIKNLITPYIQLLFGNNILGVLKHTLNITAKTRSKSVNIKRGDIFYADLSPVVGSEQGGLRPVLIVQNDVGNKYSPTVIAAAITSRVSKNKLPTHIDLCRDTPVDLGLAKDSIILLEQIRTLDKRRLKEKMGHLDDGTMRQVNDALTISFGLEESATTDVDVELTPIVEPVVEPVELPTEGEELAPA